MIQNALFRLSVATLVIVFAGMLTSPAVNARNPVTGQARAVLASDLGTTVLADTGTLGSTSDMRDATLDTGSIPSVLSAEVLRAITVGSPDQVASEASVANLNLAVGGTGISADLVMASALAKAGAPVSASSIISNLSINGAAIDVTGEPNQTVLIPGGQVVINEQTASSAGTTVNALHATVLGVADVVIASATAGVQ